jgi:ABC-type branched-subunit amino acid transport system ATPase component
MGREASMAGANPLRQVLSSRHSDKQIAAAVEEALELTGTARLANEQAGLLPIGQRRLVELARVLAGPFDMLLLDEPSSGLDGHETEEFGKVLRTATGFVRPRSGRIDLDGVSLAGDAPHKFTRRGICHLPEGRGIFPSLTVMENLAIQARGADVKTYLADYKEFFPNLAKRLGQTAGSLSGGEQQMLALSRAYLTSPKVILVDEPSLGLAPRIIDRVYELLTQFAARGVSLVVE